MAVACGGKRNIIVLGKTGCGKSTLSNKIVCADEDDIIFEVQQSFQAVTTKIESAIQNVKIDDDLYQINMIDTIGFRDARKKGGMSDSKIIEAVKKHMKERASEGINLIIFVFRNGRFTEEEKTVFEVITKNFTDLLSEMSMLVITGCDGLNETARKQVIRKFRTDPMTSQFAAIMKKGIYTVGFPSTKDLTSRRKQVVIEEMEEDIAPIHQVISKARVLYLQSEIQLDTFWQKCSRACVIM